VPHLEGPIEISHLEVVDDAGGKLLERVSLTLPLDERVALAAAREQEAEALAEALARLVPPSRGRIAFGGAELSALPEAVTGRRIAYVGPSGFFPQAQLGASLVHLLKQAPVGAASGEEAERKRELAEARRSANSLLDSAADWVDRAAAGASDEAGLLQRLRAVARVVRLEEDIIAFGLTGTLDPDAHAGLAEVVVAARAHLSERMHSGDLSGLVEPFSEGAYHWQSTIAENLMFGAPIGPRLRDDELVASAPLRAVLAECGLEPVLYELGRKVAATTLEMFEGLPPDHPFFAELTFLRADEMGDYRALLKALEGRAFADVERSDRYRLIRLALAYVEPRHRMVLIDEGLAADIVAARAPFRARLPTELAGSIEFYDAARYMRSASLLDNILFGRIVSGIAGAPQRVLAAVRALLRQLELDDRVFEVGLAFDIGSGGSRLTLAQRQKLDVARSLVKRADYLILNRPLSAVSAGEQEGILRDVIAASRDPARPFGVLWVLPPGHLTREFDKVAVLKHGAVESFGPAEEEARAHVAQR
jgi:putative ABC transport system ATP-binding protein